MNLNLSSIIVLVASESGCRMKLDVCPNILCLLLKYRVWQGYQILAVFFLFYNYATGPRPSCKK